jgi:hypothetical protein
MSLHRALGALALAGLVLTGCSKTASKSKTEDQFVAQGYTKDQAKCITDDLWDNIPKSERDKLTASDAELTTEQKTIFAQAQVTCAKDKLIEEVKTAITTTNSSVTATQVDCILGKLTDADLVAMVGGQTPVLTAAITACVSAS